METLPPQFNQDPGSTPMTPEQRQHLLFTNRRLQAFAEDAKMRMNATRLQADAIRRQGLVKIFERMKMSGVDLSNQESVSGYMDRLRQNNPETAKMFEDSMESLLSTNNNNENPNESLPTKVSGPLR